VLITEHSKPNLLITYPHVYFTKLHNLFIQSCSMHCLYSSAQASFGGKNAFDKCLTLFIEGAYLTYKSIFHQVSIYFSLTANHARIYNWLVTSETR